MTAPVTAAGAGGRAGGPIFLLGIQRGGTNQLLNILRSHPDTCWPQGEFHEVFRWRGLRREGPRAVIAKTLRYAPIRLGAGDILDPDRRAPRAGLLTGRRGRAVAAALAAATAANRTAVLGYKAALRAHGLLDGAAAPTRMLVKVMNYNLLFAPDLHALYPDAVFVGLIRDAVAVCEGHIARGATVAGAAEAWAFAASQLVELQARLPLRVWRFEDLVAETAADGRRGLRLLPASIPPPRAGSACRTRSASSMPEARSAAPARSSSSTASTRWAGTCAPTPTPARGRLDPAARADDRRAHGADAAAFRLRRPTWTMRIKPGPRPKRD